MATCNWPLGNDQTLEFTVYELNTSWNNVSGLYIFAYYDGQLWRALYIGQADDFNSRMSNHERLQEAIQKGASHIHAKTVTNAVNRDRWEQMLINHIQPPMNTQHR